MTTTITINTHVWPVELMTQEVTPPNNQNGFHGIRTRLERVIPPNSSATISIWQGKNLIITELPKPDDV